jgi:uncharacterized protein (DUF488 family)
MCFEQQRLSFENTMPALNLYTFGYEGLDIETFIARLLDAGVRTVVDVRELPLSRKKGFSKTAFCERLAQAKIAYFHAPALGCPKEIRDQYRIDKDWERYTRDFMAYLASQQSSVAELAKVARATAACLVCFEADYSMCHRTYVARAAHKLGAPTVKHLTAKTAFADRPLRLAA